MTWAMGVAVLLGISAGQDVPPADHAFDQTLIENFRVAWRKGPVLRAAPHGLKRMNMDGLHAVIAARAQAPQDDAAEQNIRAAISDAGIVLLPTDSLLVRCRGDLCETLYADHRSRRQRMDEAQPGRAARIGDAAFRQCQSRDRYPASLVGGLPNGVGTLSFFCIRNPVVEDLK